jgi:hypothetical protein
LIIDEINTRSNNIDTWRIAGGISYEIGLKTTMGAMLAYYDSSGREITDNFNEFQASIDLTRKF